MVVAKKKFGQNFLKDKGIVQKIIESMPKDDLNIVEIGPGLGDLTSELLNVSKKVYAYEIDVELCKILSSKFKKEISEQHLELISGDVLDGWREGSLRDDEYHLIANLPYNVATKIILNALRDTKCKSLVVMMQKEVAEKFTATNGDRNFSYLGIICEYFSNAKILFDVPPTSFEPMPRVMSSVISFEKHTNVEEIELTKFESFLRSAFMAPRKKVLTNLRSNFAKDSLEKLFKTLELDGNSRASDISSVNYFYLFKNL